ncbi:hypothetical protein RhiirA4_486787, partial [Rhizophagus irregularis]
MSKTIFSSEISVHSFNLYMDTVSTNFLKAINDNVRFYSPEETGNLIKWNIHSEAGKFKLEVFKKGKLINTRIENFHYPYKYGNNDFRNDHELIESSLFNNNDIIILTTIGILIYTFSEKDKSIILNYFYYIDRYKYRQHYKKIFSKSTLPLPNYDSFRLDGWVSDIINIKLNLMKYGGELLKFAIKEHKLELIDDIYKK